MNKNLSYSFSFLLLTSLAVLISCQNPENDPGPSASDSVLTVEDRMAVLERCEAKATELNNLRTIQDRAELITWLALQPEFAAYGFFGRDVYAVFRDDRILLFPNTPFEDETGGRTATEERLQPRPDEQVQSTAGRTKDLPKSAQASLFLGMGRIVSDNTAGIEFFFAKSRAGYVPKRKEASVDVLKTVSGDGIFYIYTHGGVGYVPSVRRQGAESAVMSLWTTTPVTAANDTLYKNDIRDRVLAYSIANHDSRDIKVKHYSITDKFIEKYMSFGANCFIYLDACNGYSSLPDADILRKKMMDKATNKKATILGWTDITNNIATQKTSYFFFDRLLAANTEGLGDVVLPKENPIQRPFDLEQVFKEMYRNNLGVASQGGQFVYTSNVEDEVHLRPSIEGLEIDEYTSTLIIKGRFPIDQGKVSVEDVFVNITSWSPYEINCIIPETGEGSVGKVVVSSAQGIKSNSVPLTEYILKLNFSADDNGVKLAGVCDLRLRVDIHKRRLKIHEQPVKPTYPDLSPISGSIFNMKGSSVAYTITGHKYQTCNIDQCRMQVTESPRPVAARLDFSTSGTNSQFFGFYNWSDEMKKIKLNFLSIAPPLTGSVTEERVQCPDKPEAISTVEIAYKGSMSFPVAKATDYPTFEVAENYNIRPGNFYQKVDRQWGFCLNEVGKYEVNVSWDVIRPRFAPDEETMSREDNSGD